MAGLSRAAGKRLTIAGVLVVAAVVCATGGADAVLRVCGLGKLAGANEQYLTGSFDRAVRLFGVLSAAKVALAVVKGTQVGVGVGIQVGDVVQAAYDFVDIAWRTVLVSGVVLLGTRFLLHAAGLVDHWLLAGACVAGLAALLLAWYGRRLARAGTIARDLAALLVVCAVVAYVALPVSVATGAWLSRHTTARSLSDAEEGFTRLSTELSSAEGQGAGLLSQLTDAAGRIAAVAGYLTRSAGQLSVATFRLVAAYVFDCLVFPLALLAVLLFGARAGGRYVLARLRECTFLGDIEAVFERSLARVSPPR